MAKHTSSSPAPRKRAASKKPNGAASAAVARPEPTENDIRVRAYHRYLERGGGDGADFDDWLEAEKDLKATRS